MAATSRPAADMAPALANRSFLYRGASSAGTTTASNTTTSSSSADSSSTSTSSSNEDLVVAALKQRLHQHQDPSTTTSSGSSTEPKKQKPLVPPKPHHLVTSLKNTRNVLRILEPSKTTSDTTSSTPVVSEHEKLPEPPPPPPPPPPPSTFASQESMNNGDDYSDSDTWSNHRSSTSSIYDYSCLSIDRNKKKHHSKDYYRKDDGERPGKKKSRDYTFAKNVLHYVPITSKRYYKKSRKLASKSLSLKSLDESSATKAHSPSPSSKACKDEPGTLKSRSLSREELKYVTISLPSNFTHVASATRTRLMTSDADPRRVTQHEPKYADLRGGETVEYAEIGIPGLKISKDDEDKDKDEEEVQVVRGSIVNNSFLKSWSRQSRTATPPKNGDEEPDYTEMELPAVPQEPSEEKNSVPTTTSSSTFSSSSSIYNDAYDEVDPTPLDYQGIAISPEKQDQQDKQDKRVDRQEPDEVYEHLYDVVGSKLQAADSTGKDDKEEQKTEDNAEAGDSQGDEAKPAKEKQEVEEEEEEEEGIYDHVGLPVRRPPGFKQEERVNSLYAQISPHADKESEWEDLDDPVYANILESKPPQPEPSSHPTPSKKKGGPRWAKNKVRRHCSRASRKSSARSTSRTRTRVAVTGVDVAVSLGTGSVLLLGQPESEHEEEKRLPPPRQKKAAKKDATAGIKPQAKEQEQKEDEERCKGLVQIRLLHVEENQEEAVQEATLYVDSEDSSDDSNYETLETYEPDDFSSDSEHDESLPATRPQHLPGLISLDQAPYRAVPAPPREASLGQSLGRHMKILRRTWSITKGSLGRHVGVMRRRTSADHAQSPTTPESAHTSPGSSGADLARKYFSFKKHFRKSQASSAALSTFYLDKETAAQEEPIYSNGDWYKEVGLYSSLPRPTEPPPSPPVSATAQAASVAVSAPVIDHYSVLAEEPLYQFYTAAATRVAFESDSDGYEEVEELTPSTATTELARPGHRTLWCQTPQVINKGLLPRKKYGLRRSADLQLLYSMKMPLLLLSFRSKACPYSITTAPEKLTMEERKIQEAKFEILTSEASYLNSLRVLENEFASNQELANELLTSAEWEKLFGAVPNVLLASERFLAELETIWHEDPMLAKLPELLLKHGEKSAEVYVNYCSNQVSIDTTLKELKARKGFKFLETVSRIEMHPACHHLSLHSFLMLPMQRITRLPLLADAVLSKLSVDHPERLTWERVLATLSDIVGKCNEGARLAERRNEMDALARKLEYPANMEPVLLHDKELIRSGLVTQLSTKADTEYKLTFGKKFQKTPLMLMLLTDYLLVTKLKSNSNEETYSVLEKCKRSYVALESAPEDSPFAGRHAMVLTLLENHAGRQVEYILTCENDTEKKRWLDAVSPPEPTCVGETLYESWDCPQVMALYSYQPGQPDELALQPGDVINVLRKMNDGWSYGEKLLDGEQGWFPGNFTKEVASEHVRARNLRQRHRLLALSGSVLQRKAKQSLSLL